MRPGREYLASASAFGFVFDKCPHVDSKSCPGGRRGGQLECPQSPVAVLQSCGCPRSLLAYFCGRKATLGASAARRSNNDGPQERLKPAFGRAHGDLQADAGTNAAGAVGG